VIDVVPTILELAGGRRPEKWKGEPVPAPPGKSLVRLLANDAEVSRDSLWWLHENNRAVRVGDWKLVAAAGAPWELYDLKTDRCEARNLADRHPDKVRELERVWQRQYDEYRALASRDAPPDTKPANTKPASTKPAKKKASKKPGARQVIPKTEPAAEPQAPR